MDDRLSGRDDDCASRTGDGVRRDERRHRLHLPRAPDALGSAQGSGDGGDWETDPHLTSYYITSDLVRGSVRIVLAAEADPGSRPGRRDQPSQLLISPSNVKSFSSTRAGATGGHSMQRAWMLGAERIARTSPSIPASCCSG